ncbi:MAG: phytanoyl-CoA dioxygenase family protein [Gammaproteobacteria bacterium]|nr:phytanoyl-CoA dioxygenase family protein [Gammaproteobacteria bacterium]
MLSDKQLKDFERDGFLVVKALYDKNEMEDVLAWTEEVTNFPEVPGKYMMYFEKSSLDENQRILSRMEDFEPYHQGFSRLFNDERMKGYTSQLFNEKAVLYKDKINFKMPGGDGFKAHQDVQAGWDRYAKYHITVLLSVDASTAENGCLEMAVGQHKQGLIGEQWQPLDEDALNYVSVPTEPGDAVFFDSFAPHRSAPNLTDKARRVLYVTYNRLSEGDQRRQYYQDKRASYPPDIERDADKDYVFRV